MARARPWFFASRKIAFGLSLCAAVLGIVVLAGWAFDLGKLKSVFTGSVTMKANTALAMLFCGLALALLSREKATGLLRLPAASLALVVVGLSALTLGEYFFGWQLGIDQWLFHDAPGTAGTSQPGRMSPTTALCFVLTGSALLVTAAQRLRLQLPIMAAFGVTVTIVGGLVLVGYTSGGLLGFQWGNYTGVAIHTAAGFFMLGMALLALVKNEGGLAWVLDRSVTAGFVAAIAVMLIAAAGTYNLINKLVDASQWVSHTQEVLKELNAVAAGMANLESSQRGYIVTGDERTLEGREETHAAIHHGMAALRTLTADNPMQQRRLDQLEPLIAQRAAFGDQAIVVRRQQGFAVAEQMIAAGAGIALSEKINQLLKDMEGEEYTLLDKRQTESMLASTAAFLVLPLGVFLSLTLLSFGLFFLNANVTERKRAEETLRLLGSAAEQSKESILITDAELDWPGPKIIFVNHAFTQMTGYAREEAVGKTPRILQGPHTDKAVLRRLRQNLEQGDVFAGEAINYRKDGTEFDLEWQVAPLRNAGGKITHFVATQHDITERKRTEEARRESEARYRALFEYAPDGILIADSMSRYLDANASMCRMLGYSHGELVGLQAADIVVPTEIPHVGPALEAIKTKSDYHREWKFRRKDGSVFDADVIATLMPDGNLLGMIRDITERKRTEAAIFQLANIVTYSDDAIIGKDLNSIVTSWNAGAEKIFGYAAEEMIGRSIMRIIPADRRQEEDLIMGRIRRGESVEHFETVREAKDGWLIHVSVTVSPINDDQGKIMGASKIVRDITGSKAAQTKIRQLNAELEQRVVERTAQLESANKELEAFSYSVSHDLRAPLRAMDGFSQAVMEDYGPQLPEEGRRYLQTIRVGAQKMGMLIDDLLTFSRLSRQPLNTQTVNTGQLVEGVLEEMQAHHPEHAAEIHVGKLPLCQGDPALLKQVWVNLLSNAFKYSRNRHPAVIEIGCRQTETESIYFVRDNGTGFDMRYAHKLFGVFQRLHRAEEFEGTGVGLAIVQRVVHRHGGRVWAEAEPDRGATFYFTLNGGTKS